jgi:hypothetical protein
MEKYVDKVVCHQFSARRSGDRCLLSLNDRVQHVLNDNESIEIGEIFVAILIYDVFLI